MKGGGEQQIDLQRCQILSMLQRKYIDCIKNPNYLCVTKIWGAGYILMESHWVVTKTKTCHKWWIFQAEAVWLMAGSWKDCGCVSIPSASCRVTTWPSQQPCSMWCWYGDRDHYPEWHPGTLPSFYMDYSWYEIDLLTYVSSLHALSDYSVLKLGGRNDCKHTWHLHEQIEYELSDYSAV